MKIHCLNKFVITYTIPLSPILYEKRYHFRQSTYNLISDYIFSCRVTLGMITPDLEPFSRVHY